MGILADVKGIDLGFLKDDGFKKWGLILVYRVYRYFESICPYVEFGLYSIFFLRVDCWKYSVFHVARLSADYFP